MYSKYTNIDTPYAWPLSFFLQLWCLFFVHFPTTFLIGFSMLANLLGSYWWLRHLTETHYEQTHENKNHRAYIETWPINFKFIISSIHTLMVIFSTNQFDHKGVKINYTILIVDLGRKRSDHFSSLYNFLFLLRNIVNLCTQKERDRGK